MKTPTYQDYLANPEQVIEQVRRAAARERAEAVDELIVKPIKQAFRSMTSNPTPDALPQRG